MKKLLCALLCAGLLALCACGVQVPARVEDALFVDGAYVRVCYLDNGEKKPVVLVGHGLGGDSAGMLSTGRALADAGFFVLLPDMPNHGQNRGTGPDCLVEVVIAASGLYDRLLDAFAEDPNADTGRVGVTGFSMGAMTAFYYAANGRHPVTAAAPCCGTPDFTELSGQRVAYLRCPVTGSFENGPCVDEARQREIDVLLREASPLEKLKDRPGLRLFMQNGDEDAYFPLQAVRELADSMDGAQLEVLSGQGHIYTEGMRRALTQFFVETLL